MSDYNSTPPEEDPRSRFRRLLEEAEKAEHDATVPFEVDPFDDEEVISEQALATRPQIASDSEFGSVDEYGMEG